MNCVFHYLFTATLLCFGVVSACSQSIIKHTTSLTTEEISKLTSVADGTTVFNISTGCLNYFYNGLWNEACGNCIPQFSKPVIKKITPLLNGIEIELADTGYYQALLLPDSDIVVARTKKMVIDKPVSATANKKHRLFISNLNDLCYRRPVADTFIVFSNGAPTATIAESKYAFTVFSTGKNIWMTEPLGNFINDEKVSTKTDGKVYYNWISLNRDSFNFASPVYYSKNVCPTSFSVPTDEQAEDLIAFSKQQATIEEFKISTPGFVYNPAGKTEVGVGDKNIFMLKNSEHPDGFNVLIFEGREIRKAVLPREVYVRILCVSSE